MNKDFLRLQIKSSIYQLKEGTKSSYYFQSGESILPSRLDIALGSTMTNASPKGRILSEKVVGEIRGTFKKIEESPLKQFKPFKINSRIFRKVEFPHLTGWSSIAISDQKGKTRNEEGVAVFLRTGVDILEIFFVAGKPLPDLILAVCEIVSETIKEREGQ